ncbi:MAG: NAD(+) diphosphatase [Treponema sp.]|jgi:NAD+ diphosphatase|nr:NAD(+) diphosphatase [Treponema sp.]
MIDDSGRVYLFDGGNLLVPGGMNDGEAVRGVERGAVLAAFGEQAFYAAPACAAGEPPIIAALLEAADTKRPPLPEGWTAIPVRRVLAAVNAEHGRAGRMLRAYHLLQWRGDSLYCGSCGARNEDDAAELARRCPVCGRVEFPRISPAIITLITREDGRALLAHNKKFSNNVYSLIAGFTEAGESLEAAVIRETAEEVNISVKNIRYVTSQSWPFPNSLMVGFTAAYAGGELKADGVEITDAQWFSRESVRGGTPDIPSPGSVSRCIIDRWIAGKLT